MFLGVRQPPALARTKRGGSLPGAQSFHGQRPGTHHLSSCVMYIGKTRPRPLFWAGRWTAQPRGVGTVVCSMMSRALAVPTPLSDLNITPSGANSGPSARDIIEKSTASIPRAGLCVPRPRVGVGVVFSSPKVANHATPVGWRRTTCSKGFSAFSRGV